MAIPCEIYAVEDHTTQWTEIVGEVDHINHGRKHRGMDGPVDVVTGFALHMTVFDGPAITAEPSVGVTSKTPGRYGN